MFYVGFTDFLCVFRGFCRILAFDFVFLLVWVWIWLFREFCEFGDFWVLGFSDFGFDCDAMLG